MAVKLSRKCGCKRKTRNKQTKRGKTMKGGSRGSRPGHSGSVRVRPGSMRRAPLVKLIGSIPKAAQKPIAFTSTVMGPVSVPYYLPLSPQK